MSERVIRGTRHGLFTFRANEYGPDVLMTWEHWRDQVAWSRRLSEEMHLIMMYLTAPVDDESIVKAFNLAANAVSREVGEDGFEDRRGR